MDDDVSISADGGGEVCVSRDVEGIVEILGLLLHTPSAEIASQLLYTMEICMYMYVCIHIHIENVS